MRRLAGNKWRPRFLCSQTVDVALQWSHETSRSTATLRPGLDRGALRWLSTASMSWRGSPVSVPATSAPTANVGCWTRRAGSAVRRSTTTTICRSCAPSTSCFAAASTRPTSPSSSRACVKAPTWQTSWASSAPYWGRARTTRGRCPGRRAGSSGEPSTARPRAIDIDPRGDAAARLIEYGLAEMREGDVVVVDPTIAEILARTADQLLYVRALLRHL